jgi:hypothetical protein
MLQQREGEGALPEVEVVQGQEKRGRGAAPSGASMVG